DAAAEGHVQALAQADRHAAPVDHAQIYGVAARDGAAERADEAQVELRLVRAEPAQRLEAAERVEGQVAAAVGRHLAHLGPGARATPSRARRTAGPASAPRARVPKRSASARQPAGAPGTVADPMPRSGTLSAGSDAAAGSRPLELRPTSAPSAHTMARRSPP